MTEKELLYHNLLISLHTLRWTGSPDIHRLLDLIGEYSYGHTNSTPDGYDDHEELFNRLKIGYENFYNKEDKK
jgi:hypothetical protein